MRGGNALPAAGGGGETLPCVAGRDAGQACGLRRDRARPRTRAREGNGTARPCAPVAGAAADGAGCRRAERPTGLPGTARRPARPRDNFDAARRRIRPFEWADARGAFLEGPRGIRLRICAKAWLLRGAQGAPDAHRAAGRDAVPQYDGQLGALEGRQRRCADGAHCRAFVPGCECAGRGGARRLAARPRGRAAGGRDDGLLRKPARTH